MRRTFADHVQHLQHVEPGQLTKGNRLAQALHQASDANLIHHLGQLTGAAWSQQSKGPGKRHGHRLRSIEGCCVATAHHGQHAVLSARLAARNRCVDELQAERGASRIELTRDTGRGGRVVNQHGTRLHAGKGAVGAKRHAAQIFVVADTTKNKLGVLGRQFWAGR